MIPQLLYVLYWKKLTIYDGTVTQQQLSYLVKKVKKILLDIGFILEMRTT